MTLEVKKLSGKLAARIEGLDFSKPITENTLEQIADALYANQVISIPASKMTPDQHAQIALRQGRLYLQTVAEIERAFAIEENRGDCIRGHLLCRCSLFSRKSLQLALMLIELSVEVFFVQLPPFFARVNRFCALKPRRSANTVSIQSSTCYFFLFLQFASIRGFFVLHTKSL